MADVVWTDAALRRVAEVYARIALDKPKAARRLVERLMEVGDHLADFPLRGREIAPGLRQLAVLAPYLIRYAYDPSTDVVRIIAIWHGAQDEP